MQKWHLSLLDIEALKPQDLDLSVLDKYGAVTTYDQTAQDEIIDRCAGSEVVIVNKVRLTSLELQQLPNLKLICLLATGYDNVDINYCKEHDISVFNVQDYGTESVAQHVFSFLLHHTNRIALHHNSVQQGEWTERGTFCYSLITVQELAGKTIGIIGYGQIGQRVGALAQAFNMDILVVDRGKTFSKGEQAVPLTELLQRADFVSLHAPLNIDTQHMIGVKQLKLMKDTAVLVNTGRGGLIDEAALAKALKNEKLAAAYLDVLSQEPPSKSKPHPLMDAPNCFLTPHMAWHSLQARQRLLAATCTNIDHYIDGSPHKNRLA